EDSTQYIFKLTPRFRISHRFKAASEKHLFKDMLPQTERYLQLFENEFVAEDSVISEQKWFYVDNALMLNGFLGSSEKQLLFSAGIGNRFDRFRTQWDL